MVHGRVVKTEKSDVRRAIAWRSRQLVFTATPILEAASEFNRYNRIQIRVEGDAVGEERIGGVFDADDIDTLVDFLAGDPRFAVGREKGEIVIRAQRLRSTASPAPPPTAPRGTPASRRSNWRT